MKTLNKLTLSTFLVSSSLLASEGIVDSIGVNIGISNTPYTQTNHKASITLGNTPDKQLNSYELYTTLNPISDMCKQYDMKPYISYTYSINEELKNQYILLGVNKYYTHKELKLYAGLLTGYGELKYRYNPLNNSKDNNNDANSLILGVQTGINIPLSSNLALNLNAKYLYHDYETTLEPSTNVKASLEHKYTSSLGVGVVWFF